MKLVVAALVAIFATSSYAVGFSGDISVAREKTSFANCTLKYQIGGRVKVLNIAKVESIEVWEDLSPPNPTGWLMEFITVSGRKYRIPLKPLTDQQLTETRNVLTTLMGFCR